MDTRLTNGVGEHSASQRNAPAGVVPVVETPFDTRGWVDLASLNTLARYLAGAGVHWVMYPGFASEYYKLSPLEREEALAVLLQESRSHGAFQVVAGVTDHATVLAERSAVAAVEAGAAAINLLPPYLLEPSLTETRRHVHRVLEAVHPTPVVLQVAPAFTGSALDIPWVDALAADHDNLRTLKVEHVPPGPVVTEIANTVSGLRAMVGYGGVHLIDALRRGAVGVQPGCSFTELYTTIWAAWTAGDTQRAEAAHSRLLPYLTYWMSSVELIVAVEKVISYRRGLIASTHCRHPARILDSQEQEMIERFLDEFEDELLVAEPGLC